MMTSIPAAPKLLAEYLIAREEHEALLDACNRATETTVRVSGGSDDYGRGVDVSCEAKLSDVEPAMNKLHQREAAAAEELSRLSKRIERLVGVGAEMLLELLS